MIKSITLLFLVKLYTSLTRSFNSTHLKLLKIDALVEFFNILGSNEYQQNKSSQSEEYVPCNNEEPEMC